MNYPDSGDFKTSLLVSETLTSVFLTHLRKQLISRLKHCRECRRAFENVETLIAQGNADVNDVEVQAVDFSRFTLRSSKFFKIFNFKEADWHLIDPNIARHFLNFR